MITRRIAILHRSHKSRAVKLIFVSVLSCMAVALLCLAANGVITPSPTNSVNCYTGMGCTASYRWEPSSASASGWLTSWHDIGTVRGNVDPSVSKAYTSYWSEGWAQPFEHRTSNTNNSSMIDMYLYWDAYRGRHLLVSLDYGNVLAPSVWLQYADSVGATWNPAVQVTPMQEQNQGPVWWDFPSVAVSATTGRIVVGASKLVGGSINSGYYSAWSDDMGANWNGAFTVNGTTGGALSRIVWSASGFHAFIIDKTTPSAWVLQHWQSSDGQTWVRQSPDIGTYGMPLPSSQSAGVCTGGTCGELSYAATPDAVASSGSQSLGWVIAYPVNLNGRNAINVSTELGGGVTISYSTDLFSADITTSSSGDWYLNYQSYQGGDQVLPIFQGVVYRQVGSPATYLGASILSSIDPSQWMYFNNSAGRCTAAPCFAAGDYFRPAMNNITGASIPIVIPPLNSNNDLNDLAQIFVQDPQEVTAGVPQSLPTIEPYVLGTNIASRAVLTPAHLAHINVGQDRFGVSVMTYERLLSAGFVK